MSGDGLRQRPGDQALPTPVSGVISTYEWVLNNLAFTSVPDDLYKATREFFKGREVIGIERYGQSLYPGNGRDSMRDALEEAGDLTVYLANAVREDKPVHDLYNKAASLMLDIIAVMNDLPRKV